jgi:hypothetical protein
MPKKKKPLVLSHDELEKKGTKELLGYLKRLQQCEDSFEMSDLHDNPDVIDLNTIFFKETNKWQVAFKTVKTILSTREHLNSKT